MWLPAAISIHAPHEGERRLSGRLDRPLIIFQSTLPTRGSDLKPDTYYTLINGISIHAPHEGERRRGRAHTHHCSGNFNPRSPRGGATCSLPHSSPFSLNFNPRSPRGGATIDDFSNPCPFCISIHAPHEGERRNRCTGGAGKQDFNPRSPRGGATHRYDMSRPLYTDFNPRSPRGGATLSNMG